MKTTVALLLFPLLAGCSLLYWPEGHPGKTPDPSRVILELGQPINVRPYDVDEYTCAIGELVCSSTTGSRLMNQQCECQPRQLIPVLLD